MHHVIIGNGVAGIEAAIALRRRHEDARITLVSEESEHFFSRTALMYILAGQLTHRDTEPYERDLYARMGFTRVRARAIGVDPAARSVRLAGDLAPLSYDRLLIASGSRPRPAPWPGGDLPGIGTFVTHQDLAWLERELHGGPGRGGAAPAADAHLSASTDDSPYRQRPVARTLRGSPPQNPMVIGGGLIGIEVIETMLAAGLKPRFVIREEFFWPMAIDAAESAWIQERLREHGVDVLTATQIERFEGDGAVERAVLDSGQTVPCDLCVVAIGVMPNTDWLADSGIERDPGGGIVVGPDLRSSAPGVYAAGDCASVTWFNGSRRPEQLWYTSRDQGRVAAAAMSGDDVAYKRGHWYNSAKLIDIEYTTAGLVDFGYDDLWSWFHEERGAVRSTTRIVCRPGEGDQARVVGFNMLGRRWDHTVLIRWIAERRSLSWVLDHLSEARFDTELVPPLRIPPEARRAPDAAAR
ncbi:MAG: FAD-dependent oxidoreductase [Alphaproteobacteria bacterium]|nr:FAD-dependent oxidoreductase [Alphaproteobacteria bacterium]